MTDQTFIYRLFLVHLMANQLTFAVLVSRLYKSELPPLTVKMARAWKKKKKSERERGGIILLPCDFHSPLRSWKWQDAVCFCLLINISEHYTWNAPVTLNIGPVRTSLLSSLVIWHQVMRIESWKAVHQAPPPPFRFPNKICERIAGRCWSLYKIKCRETQRKYWICVEDWYRR